MKDTLWSVPLPEGGVLRIVWMLGFLLGVQVVETSEELVKPVVARQVFVQVAEVVLPELAGPIALRLEILGNGGVLGLEPEIGAGKTDFGQTGPEGALPSDEGCTSRGTALLAICVGEIAPSRARRSMFGVR